MPDAKIRVRKRGLFIVLVIGVIAISQHSHDIGLKEILLGKIFPVTGSCSSEGERMIVAVLEHPAMHHCREPAGLPVVTEIITEAQPRIEHLDTCVIQFKRGIVDRPLPVQMIGKAKQVGIDLPGETGE